MEDFSDIDKHYNEDVSLLLTLSMIPEFQRDHHDIKEIENKVVLNAIKYEGKWYEVLNVPEERFSLKSLVWDDMQYMQEITKDDLKVLGFNMSIYDEGKNYDTLRYDPKDNDLKVVRHYLHYDFVCLHKRINKPGEVCPGQLSECNNRGNCFEGECYCLNGFIGSPCICEY